jgi:hypothetical protein
MSRAESPKQNTFKYLQEQADLKKQQADAGFSTVGQLLAEGRKEEAFAMIKAAADLQHEADVAFMQVGRLLASGDKQSAFALIGTAAELDQKAKAVLEGPSNLPANIVRMIERAQASEAAFTPDQLQYITSRLAMTGGLVDEDREAFRGIGTLLATHGFTAEVTEDELFTKIERGFADVGPFFDAQPPEGELVVAALMNKSPQELEELLASA